MRFLFPSFLLLISCDSDKSTMEPSDEENIVVDSDADGFDADEDCDDEDDSIHPAATEICDGLDNNCDGEIDEGVTITIYADSDEDGYGSANNTQEACEILPGYASNGNDCDDTEPDAFPGNTEV